MPVIAIEERVIPKMLFLMHTISQMGINKFQKQFTCLLLYSPNNYITTCSINGFPVQHSTQSLDYINIHNKMDDTKTNERKYQFSIIML